jgi:hypothetical protein
VIDLPPSPEIVELGASCEKTINISSPGEKTINSNSPASEPATLSSGPTTAKDEKSNNTSKTVVECSEDKTEVKILAEPKKILIICPSCFVKIPMDKIGSHIIDKHPNLVVVEDGQSDVEEMTAETESLASKPSESVLILSEKRRPHPVIIWDPSSTPGQQRRSSTFNSTPASEACVRCVAPGCSKFVHHSNMARHWRCWHPGLNRSDFQNPKRPSKTRSSSTTSSEVNNSKEELLEGVKSEAILKVEVGDIIDFRSTNVLASTNLPMVKDLYVCMFDGCEYSTKFNSNKWRHQRKYNHIHEANRTF